MSDKRETQGKTVEHAVSEALLQMGARKDEVKITVLEEPRSGFLGILGHRQAKVLVERKNERRGRGQRDYRDRDDDGSAHDLSGGGSTGGQKRGRGSRGRRTGDRQARPDQARPGQGEGARGGRNQRNKTQVEGRPADQSGNQPGNQSSNQSSPRSGGRGSGSREQGDGRSRGRGRQDSQSRSPQDRPDRQSRPERQETTNQSASVGNSATVETNGGPEGAREQNRPEPRRGRHPRGGSGGSPRQDRNRTAENSPDRGREEARSGPRNESTRPRPAPVPRNESAPGPAPVPDTMLVSGLKASAYCEPVRNVAEVDLDDTITSFTSGILNRAGFPCRCEVKNGEYRQVRVITGDDSAGMLIGRHGSTVDAVEHLIERMMGVAAGDRVRLNLDINNYRRRREEVLVSRVAEAAERVKETERDYHMEPMCARERRLIHLEAEKYDSIRTYTLMQSGDKHVVIAPGKGEAVERIPGDDESAPEILSSVDVLMDTSLETTGEMPPEE